MEKDTSLSRISEDFNSYSGVENSLAEGEQAPAVSDYEQQIWLLQQQQPELVLKRIFAWRLDDNTDMAQFDKAVRLVVPAEPELKIRFQFNDDFELLKAPASDAGVNMETLHLSDKQDMFDLLLERQAIQCDLHEQAPYSIFLITAGGKKYIAFILHRILDENIDAGILLQKIAATSRGEKLVLPEPKYKAVFAAPNSSAAVLPLLKRGDTIGAITTGNVTLKSAASHAWQMVLRDDMLPPEIVSRPDTGYINGFIAEQFVRMFSQLGPHERLLLRLNDSGNLHNFVFDGSVAAGHLAEQVREALQNSDRVKSDLVGLETLPLIDLTVNEEAETVSQAGYPVVEKILLPLCGGPSEILLDISVMSDQQTVLTLRTAPDMLSMAGEWLLDRLATALRGEELSSAEVLHGTAETGMENSAYVAIILQEFRRALAAPQMQANEDFFDCGGHSMLATRVIGRLLTEHGLEVQFNDFFKFSTALGLAAKVKPVQSDSIITYAQMNKNHMSAAVPLSFAQMSMWRGYELFDYGAVFNLPFALNFLDEVDEQVFASAFQDILVRHAGLRSHFYRSGDKVYQQIIPADQLDQYHWFWASQESAGVKLHDEHSYLFDLATEMPLRLRFIRDEQTGRQILSFLFHHLALDEWSLNMMMDELSVAYEARLTGHMPQWEQAAPSMADFSRQQYERGLDQSHIDYWKNMLTDATHGLQLPPVVMPDEEEDNCGDVDWLECAIEQETINGLYSLARANNASLFNVIYAMIGLSLHKIGNLPDVVIGTSADGRTDARYYDTVGYFTTMVAHRIPFNPVMTIAELIGSCRDIVVGSMPYTDVPIDIIEESLGIIPGRDRFFEVYVQIHAQNKLNGNLPDGKGGAIRYRQIDPDKDEAMLGMQFEIMEEYIGEQRNIRLIVTYRRDRFSPGQMQKVTDTLSKILKTLVLGDTLNKRLSEVSIQEL